VTTASFPSTTVPPPVVRVARGHRAARLVGAALVIGALALGTVGCDSPVDLNGPAGRLYNMLSDYRSAYGRGQLTPVADATAKAEAQAQAMANAHQLFHSSLASGIDPGWFTIGENVGYGPNIEAVENAFIASPDHRANMLNSAFNQVGIGVATTPDGLVWIAEEFVGR
jgi:uncharacterized protein YkwD